MAAGAGHQLGIETVDTLAERQIAQKVRNQYSPEHASVHPFDQCLLKESREQNKASMMSLPILNCEYPGWGFQLLTYLSSQTELDLINFNFDDHRVFCEYWDSLAKQHSMEIDDYDPKAKAIHFRRKAN